MSPWRPAQAGLLALAIGVIDRMAVALGGGVLGLAPATCRRLWRFALVGVLATLTYAGGTVVAVEWAGLRPVAASCLAFLASVLVSWRGQSRFAFADADPAPPAAAGRGQMVRFLAVTMATFGLSTAIMAAGGWLGAPYGVALALVIAVVPGANYLGYRHFAFRAASAPVSTRRPPAEPA